MSKRPHRIVRLAGGIGLSLLCLVALAMFLTVRLLQGASFGRLIQRNLPRTRGAVHIGGGHWTWAAVWDLWRGRPASLSVDDVQLFDPENTLVFRAAHIAGRVAVDRSSGHVVISELRVQDVTWRFARMRARASIGFLAALTPAPRATPRSTQDSGAPAPPRGGNGGWLQIVDADIEGLDAVFAFPQWDLTLRDVRVRGGLTFDGASQARPAFVFQASGADVRGGGTLGVLGPPWRRTLSFSRARLNRVATTADAPDAIVLDASSVVAGRSTLAFNGSFGGVYGNGGRAPPPGMTARIDVRQAADAIQAILSSGGNAAAASPSSMAAVAVLPPTVSVGGGVATALGLSLAGPFSALSVTANVQGFDLRAGGFDLRDVGFRLAGQPEAGRLNLTGLTATSPQGGQLRVDAAVDGARAQARVAFVGFATGAAMPRFLEPFLAGTLDGTIAGKADLPPGPGSLRGGSLRVSLDDLTLFLARPSAAPGPRVLRLRLPPRRPRPTLAEGAVALPIITASVWGGRLTVGGTLSLRGTPTLDATVAADDISIERIVGTSFVTGTLSFRAHAHGTLQDLNVHLRPAPRSSLRLLGQPFRLPGSLSFRVGPAGLSVPELKMDGGYGGTLGVAGHVALDGRMNLTVGVRAFPFAKLPAFVDTALPLAGRLDGRLRIDLIGGDQESFSAAGRLAVADTTFQGRPIGGGALELTPEAHGALRVKGQLIDGVTVDGHMRAGQGGLTGEARVWLRELRLAPFVGPLAGGGTTITGTVSGTAAARIAPGTPALIEGSLTKVSLGLTGAPLRTARTNAADDTSPGARFGAPAVDLHANDLVFYAQGGGGRKEGAVIRIAPTVFSGNAASVQLGGGFSSGRAEGTIRGTLDLAVLSRLVFARWPVAWPGYLIDGLSGSARVDLRTVTSPQDPWPLVTGQVLMSMKTALRSQQAGAAAHDGIPIQITNGRFDFRPDGRVTAEVPLVIAGSTLRIGGGWIQRGSADQTRLAFDASGELEAGLLRPLTSPTDLRNATGRLRVKALVGGTVERPTFNARVDIGSVGIALTLPSLGTQPVRIVTGRIDIDETSAQARDVNVQLGARGNVTIGPASDGPAALRFEAFQPLAVTHVDIPLRGALAGIAAGPTAMLDDARFAVRLRGARDDAGEGERPPRLSLSGDIDIVKARVNTKAVPATGDATGAAGPSTLLKRRVLQDMQLDLRVRSQHGAVTAQVPYVPDVRVDVDYQVRGTAAHPRVSGELRSTGLYNRAALSLYRLFH